MKNNYDLIINFETKDGEPLTYDEVFHLLVYAENLVEDMYSDGYDNLQFWKTIISQAVDSKRITVGSKTS